MQFGGVVPLLYEALGGTDAVALAVWQTAWTMLSGFWQEFDHFTDGDIQQTSGAPEYGLGLNGSVGYGFAATALLDDLETTSCDTTRAYRLRRLWNDCFLRTAAGQQRDMNFRISPSDAVQGARELLTASQELARVKAGALYALAFGGTAILTTDDQATIDVMKLIGEVYGMLLMHGDDVRDVNDPNESSLSFAQAYLAAAPNLAPTASVGTLEDFFQFVYQQYLLYVGQLTMQLAKPLREFIRQLFATTFERGGGDEPDSSACSHDSSVPAPTPQNS